MKIFNLNFKTYFLDRNYQLMETGQNGHLGVAVFQTVEKTGPESAKTLHQCLVELIVLETQLKNQHFCVMEVTAVQVTKRRVQSFFLTCLSYFLK